MNLLFTKAVVSGISVPAEDNTTCINDYFKYKHDTSEDAPTNENLDEEELLPSSDDNFDIGYKGDTIKRVSREVFLSHSSRAAYIALFVNSQC